MACPKVSGRKTRKARDAPAMIVPAQNVHRQLVGEMKPETIGEKTGPSIVEAMNMAMARPLVTGSP